MTGAGDYQVHTLDVTLKETTNVCVCATGRVKRLATAPQLPFLFWSASEDGAIRLVLAHSPWGLINCESPSLNTYKMLYLLLCKPNSLIWSLNICKKYQLYGLLFYLLVWWLLSTQINNQCFIVLKMILLVFRLRVLFDSGCKNILLHFFLLYISLLLYFSYKLYTKRLGKEGELERQCSSRKKSLCVS